MTSIRGLATRHDNLQVSAAEGTVGIVQVMEDGEDGDAEAEEPEADGDIEAKIATMANEYSSTENEHHSAASASEDGAGDGSSKSAIPALLQVRAHSFAAPMVCS